MESERVEEGLSEFRIINADVLAGLATLPDESVHCCVTSPPYWGLRDYGVVGQLGLERTPEEYVAKMVAVFAEVRRVLRSDGTLWLNLGDSYARQAGDDSTKDVDSGLRTGRTGKSKFMFKTGCNIPPPGLKPKNLVGIPWRMAFALQAEGWYLRSDIIWHKPNPMPESVGDRPTRAHEYLFLLTKSARYYYDAAAIAERCTAASFRGSSFTRGKTFAAANDMKPVGAGARIEPEARNKRSVWSIVTEPFPDAHFAVMPTALVEPCVMAGSPEGGTVLDPFAGSGTVGVVALRHQRSFIGCELNPTYAEMARRRIEQDMPMFNVEATA